MDAERRYYSIGEMCEAFGVTSRTLRFYEDKGLLTPQRVGLNRIYGRRDRARLAFILALVGGCAWSVTFGLNWFRDGAARAECGARQLPDFVDYLRYGCDRVDHRPGRGGKCKTRNP